MFTHPGHLVRVSRANMAAPCCFNNVLIVRCKDLIDYWFE